MRTVGWNNWRPTGGIVRQSIGDVTVSLRAGSAGGEVSLKGSKAIVVHGVTLGADAAVVTGDTPVMEIQFEGLATGPHFSFVGYQHAVGGETGTYAASVGVKRVAGIKPTKDARHNDDIASSFIEFEATAGQPTVIRIAATEGDRVMLNGFALDVADPRKKALKPFPADYERHADGDSCTRFLTISSQRIS